MDSRNNQQEQTSLLGEA